MLPLPGRAPLISNRQMAVFNHPFLGWLAGMEKEIIQQPYGSDLFLSPSASRRFQVGWDNKGQVNLAVSAADRPGFASMKWIGAGIMLNSFKPGGEEEWDWLLLIADMHVPVQNQDGSYDPREPRSVLGLWLPANINLLPGVLGNSLKISGKGVLPNILRMMSVTEDGVPEPVSYGPDIAALPLVCLQEVECSVPATLLPENAPVAHKPRPRPTRHGKGKKPYGSKRKS